MTENRTAYAVLGVRPDAPDAAIRDAYQRLVRDLHPDRNPTPAAAQRTAELNAAYSCIKTPALRRRYDAGALESAAERIPSPDAAFEVRETLVELRPPATKKGRGLRRLLRRA